MVGWIKSIVFTKTILLSVLCILLLVSVVTAEIPIKECSSGDTHIEGSWLCLGEPSSDEKETCVITENGNIVKGENERIAIDSYSIDIKEYMAKNEVTGDVGGITSDESEGASAYIGDEFFSGMEACTKKYSFPIIEFNTVVAYPNTWEDHEAKALSDYTGNQDFPLLLQCGNHHDKKFVVQSSGETSDAGYDIKDIYYCTGGKWYDLEDSYKDFDEDGDNVPSLSSWDFDCDDNNPNSYSDVSMFSFAQKAGITAGAEICDDGADNLCTENAAEFFGTEFFERYDEYDDLVAKYTEDPWTLETTDDCDQNPKSCEEQCLFAGNECSYLNYVDENSNPDATTTIGTGYCCGNNLYEDLGDSPDDVPEEICINSNFVTPDISKYSEPSADGNGFQNFKNHQNQH